MSLTAPLDSRVPYYIEGLRNHLDPSMPLAGAYGEVIKAFRVALKVDRLSEDSLRLLGGSTDKAQVSEDASEDKLRPGLGGVK